MRVSTIPRELFHYSREVSGYETLDLTTTPWCASHASPWMKPFYVSQTVPTPRKPHRSLFPYSPVKLHCKRSRSFRPILAFEPRSLFSPAPCVLCHMVPSYPNRSHCLSSLFHRTTRQMLRLVGIAHDVVSTQTIHLCHLIHFARRNSVSSSGLVFQLSSGTC